MTTTGQVAVLEKQAPTPVHEKGRRKFRPDIEGLRAVAVILVIIGHSGLALAGGYIGVDVFFVISGFLITQQLHDELQLYRRIAFCRFYARRARRIVPAATVVIVATLFASWYWLSPLRFKAIVGDAVFSAISGVNWRLAEQGTDYFGSTDPPSPFQHYWSLSVEEQFYAIWPVLLVVSVLSIGGVVGRQRAMVGSLLLLVALSLSLSVTVTGGSAPLAYFGSHTRAWELGLGALLAVTAATWARLPQTMATIAGWVGLGMIAGAAWWFSDATPYPGSAALLPVVGACLVIAAGCVKRPNGVEMFLQQRPMQFAGRVSYSWYLWHWPVFVIAPVAVGHPLGVGEIAAAICFSLLLAVLTFYIIEQPIRTRKGLLDHPQRGIGLGMTIVAVSVTLCVVMSTVAIVPGGSSTTSDSLAAAQRAAASAVLVSGILPAVKEAVELTELPPVTPALESAKFDGAILPPSCFVQYMETDPDTSRTCLLGDPNGNKTVALIGDSHAAQWAGPLQSWAEKNRWQMRPMLKTACPPGLYPNYIELELKRVYVECEIWRAKVLEFIGELKPDVVVIGSRATISAVDSSGLRETVQRIRDIGSKVVFMAETPTMSSAVPDCLAQYASNIQFCGANPFEAELGAPARIAEINGAEQAGAIIFDSTPWLCTAETCPAVISKIVVYRDDNHLTNTYALTLEAPLGKAVTDAVGRP